MAQPQIRAEATEARLALSYHEGRLSMDAVNVPLAQVLAAIGEKAGLRVLIKGDLTTEVTRAFSGLPLDKALRSLLAGLRYIQVRATLGDGSGSVSELRIFGEGTAGPISVARKVPASPASATSAGADSKQEILLALQSAERAARLRAIRRLSDLDDQEAIRILSWVLESDEDAAVRGYAVRALQGFGSDLAVEALEKGLVDSEPTVRAQVVRSLGRIPLERAVLSLGLVVQGHNDAEMRRLAVQALSIQKGDSVTALLEAAAGDTNHQVSRFAKRALANRD